MPGDNKQQTLVWFIIILTMKNGWNLILIVFYLLGKFKVKGVGWAGKAQMANALSLSQ